MKTNTTITADVGDKPRATIVDSPSGAFAAIDLDQLGKAQLFSHDPTFLRDLARAAEDAAQRLSARLDFDAAQAMNQAAREYAAATAAERAA